MHSGRPGSKSLLEDPEEMKRRKREEKVKVTVFHLIMVLYCFCACKCAFGVFVLLFACEKPLYFQKPQIRIFV